MDINELKKQIQKKADELELEKNGWKISKDIYENDDFYRFSFVEDTEMPLNGITYLADKKTGKIEIVDRYKMTTSEIYKLEEMKLVK